MKSDWATLEHYTKKVDTASEDVDRLASSAKPEPVRVCRGKITKQEGTISLLRWKHFPEKMLDAYIKAQFRGSQANEQAATSFRDSISRAKVTDLGPGQSEIDKSLETVRLSAKTEESAWMNAVRSRKAWE